MNRSLASLALALLAFSCAAYQEEDASAGSSAGTGGEGTMAGFHYMANTNTSNGALFGGHRGWALEVVQGDEDWQFDSITKSNNLGFRVLARIDHAGGTSIPPTDVDPQGQSLIERYLHRVETAIARGAVGVVIGNEPNLEDECRDSAAACDPARYAAVFDAVKKRIGDRAQVMVAGLSPGRPNTNTWWKSMAAKLETCPDAFAIHAYAGVDTGGWDPSTWADRGTALYKGQADNQIALIDQTRCAGRPIFVTEFNTQPLHDLASRMSVDDARGVMGQIARNVLALEQARVRRGAPRTKAVLWFVGENRNGSWGELAAFAPGGEHTNEPVVRAFSEFGQANGSPL